MERIQARSSMAFYIAAAKPKRNKDKERKKAER